MTRIETKAVMYRLLYAGRFGNYPKAWQSLEEVERSGYVGEVSIRSRETANPLRLYHVPHNELRETVGKLADCYLKAGLVYCESPPESQVIIQGEYDGYSLTYTYAKPPMRIAFDQQQFRTAGGHAKLLLRSRLEPNDLDWLYSLLDDFPGSVVEFSAFRIPVGEIPGSKCIVWEVRHY